jgi:glycosyltransferase involved in cell wall biosynthesis
MEKKKIVFLYTELATYFLACIEALLKTNNAEIHVIHWEVNAEAPFQFSIPSEIKTYRRNSFNDKALHDLVNKINPDLIYVSGWIDKEYLKVCKQYKKRIPVIVGFDNQWRGTLRQWIAVFLSPFRILNHFTHCWVPGSLQTEFALKLGFKKNNILTGYYSCDFSLFHSQYLQNREQKAKDFPKRFIYVGRYVETKGIRDLWNAFAELQHDSPNDWELWCIGTGPLEPFIHPKIRHFGFVQPAHLPKYLKETGVFVLPSHFEPWGVVVHEFAAAGFPMVCSDEVGARVTFVEDGYNGYIYTSGNVNALKMVLNKIMNLDQAALISFGDNSVEKAKLITPEIWSKQLMTLL